MTTVILLALLLALVQIWLLPMLLNLKNANFLLSNRDNPPEVTPVLARIQRASVNLQESLPAFLAMAVVAEIQGLDLTLVASVWLALRGAYVATYGLGIVGLRSLIWIGSLVCLVYMGLALAGAVTL
jgi:uncharacterized MAPEG superfamily protein